MKDIVDITTLVKFALLLAVTIYAVSYHFRSNPFDGTTDVFGWILIVSIALVGAVASEILRRLFRSLLHQRKLTGSAVNILAFIVVAFGCWQIISVIESVLGQT